MISSTTNKQVKFVNSLMKKAKTRKDEGLFVAEGLRICAEVPRDRIHTLYVSESFQRNPEYAGLVRGVKHVEAVTDAVFQAFSDTRSPQGILALVTQCPWRFEDVSRTETEGGKPALVMVLEHIQDPGNLGTIVRAGEGAGVTGILMDEGTADMYNPKVIRSTMGSVLRVPFVYAEDFHGAVEALKQKGIRLYAAHLDGKRSYDKESYDGDTGFLIGNEAGGLTRETAFLADEYIRIPMEGRVESLNAAVAASVLMFEAARQRRD